jgi:hypothetical protein
MKKRKPPILLATMLLVLVGVVAIANVNPLGKDDLQAAPQDDKPVASQSRPEQDADTIAQNMKEAMGAGGSTTPPQGTKAPMVDEGKLPSQSLNRSKTVIPNFKPPLPTPDPNGISSLRGAK